MKVKFDEFYLKLWQDWADHNSLPCLLKSAHIWRRYHELIFWEFVRNKSNKNVSIILKESVWRGQAPQNRVETASQSCLNTCVLSTVLETMTNFQYTDQRPPGPTPSVRLSELSMMFCLNIIWEISRTSKNTTNVYCNILYFCRLKIKMASLECAFLIDFVSVIIEL